MSRVSVALVDDHPLMIEAVFSLLSRIDSFEVVATGTSAKDVVDIGTLLRPEIMIVDLGLPGDVYAAIASVASNSCGTKLVAFTASTGVDTAIRALDSGASGYVLKGSSPDELLDAIASVRSGETYITRNFATQVISALRDATIRRRAAMAVKLSIREEQIVRLLLKGKTNKEIAHAISISEKTVKHYMTILMQKLQVRNRLEVVIAAQRLDAERQLPRLHS
ncbi:LuxR C-terminal-related transcriptional regulator [Rhodopseudomonas pseudopalustris]|uniref:Response regulator receiver n=2 Tax=Rhodopseudomonas TaxID=1073 RepID=Q13AU4_RHOPS|nr:response regulator transcription factor [Rhodopseudomonas pseudopalustris]ABE38795.1 response regulator receiver [Rhodopseudomonas palustris BisB5]MBB1092698.1 response regulator transcription factor [Rhodopseudomonas palustris]SEP03654.1 two component transcriptional regulator, LuxR family [Rhodopseudomonas pseudopalustris]